MDDVSNIGVPKSSVSRVGSAGNLEAPRRISESVSAPNRGGFGPYTLISPDLPEFGANGPYMGGSVKYEPAGSAGDRIESSRNCDIPQRISLSPPWRERGGFAPLTMISPDLPEFGENGHYLGMEFEI